MDTTPHNARAGGDSVRSRWPLSVDLVDDRCCLLLATMVAICTVYWRLDDDIAPLDSSCTIYLDTACLLMAINHKMVVS